MQSVDIIFPVYYGNYNTIEKSVRTTAEFCQKNLKNLDWRIVVSINGPNPEDNIELVKKLKSQILQVDYTYTATPGKGSGIKNAWTLSKADLVAYMDIDLSVDLSSLPKMLDQLNCADIVVGSRYHPQSQVKRTIKRRVVSIVYHKLFQGYLLGTHYGDAHCGFKATTNKLAQILLPHIQDPGWFFDSEFMFLAEKLGYKILPIPIIWQDSNNVSGVNLKKVIPSFILKTLELKLRPLPLYISKKAIKKQNKNQGKKI